MSWGAISTVYLIIMTKSKSAVIETIENTGSALATNASAAGAHLTMARSTAAGESKSYRPQSLSKIQQSTLRLSQRIPLKGVNRRIAAKPQKIVNGQEKLTYLSMGGRYQCVSFLPLLRRAYDLLPSHLAYPRQVSVSVHFLDSMRTVERQTVQLQPASLALLGLVHPQIDDGGMHCCYWHS